MAKIVPSLPGLHEIGVWTSFNVNAVAGPSIKKVVSTSQLGLPLNFALTVYVPAGKLGIFIVTPPEFPVRLTGPVII